MQGWIENLDKLLADTMSRYLIRRSEDNPNIVVRMRTQLTALEGSGRLERIRWRDDRTGDSETHDIGHVFIMIGAVPNTTWLAGCVVLDENGFVKTGPDLSREERPFNEADEKVEDRQRNSDE